MEEKLNNRNTDLLKTFTLFFAVTAAGILLLTSIGVYKIYSDHILRSSEIDAVNLGLMLFDQERDALISLDSKGRDQVFVSGENLSSLDQRMRRYLKPLQIVKIKIFSKDREIVYSTDPSIIGVVDALNEKLERSLKGEIVSKMETKDKVWDLADEERIDIDLVETYCPITDKSNNVIGSFEVYVDISRYRKEIKSVLVSSVLVVFIILLGAFAFLFFHMKRAAKTIQCLMEKENSFTLLEKKRSRELQKVNQELMAVNRQLKANEQQLRNNEEELKKAKTGLEEKVKERTKELEQAKGALENKVRERTKEIEELNVRLKKRVDDVEVFNKIAMGRELRVIEIKQEVNQLLKELSRSSKYNV